MMADADEVKGTRYAARRLAALSATDPSELQARAIVDAVDGVMNCLGGLSREDLNWCPVTNEGNSLAVLAAHVLGNVEEKVLATLGGDPVQRSGPQEFESEIIDIWTVTGRWDVVRSRVLEICERLPTDRWDEECRTGSLPTLTRRAILVLVHRHASEHLGEAQLVRGLLLARPH